MGKSNITSSPLQAGCVIDDNDRNFASAYALRGAALIFIENEKGDMPKLKTRLRLSTATPCTSLVGGFCICHAEITWQMWEKAVEWCQKSIATNAEFGSPWRGTAARPDGIAWP